MQGKQVFFLAFCDFYKGGDLDMLSSLYPILKDNPLKTSGIYDVIAFSAQKLNKVMKGKIRHLVRQAKKEKEKKGILNSKKSLEIFVYFLSDHDNLKSCFTSALKEPCRYTLRKPLFCVAFMNHRSGYLWCRRNVNGEVNLSYEWWPSRHTAPLHDKTYLKRLHITIYICLSLYESRSWSWV